MRHHFIIEVINQGKHLLHYTITTLYNKYT